MSDSQRALVCYLHWEGMSDSQRALVCYLHCDGMSDSQRALVCPGQLFSSVTASLLLDMMMSALNGHAEDMSNPGLVSFGYVGVRCRLFYVPPALTSCVHDAIVSRFGRDVVLRFWSPCSGNSLQSSVPRCTSL